MQNYEETITWPFGTLRYALKKKRFGKFAIEFIKLHVIFV